MIFIKTLSKFIVLAALLIIASLKIACADGFPLRPGRLIVSPSVSYFFANSKWDSVGNKQAFPKNGQFSSISYSLYVEYGISRRFTLIASLPYLINKYQQSDYSSTNSGASDLETGLRKAIEYCKYRLSVLLQYTRHRNITIVYKS